MLVILGTITVYSYNLPPVGHGADQIKVNLGTQEKTLQEVIDILGSSSLSSNYVGTCNTGNDGECKCGLGEKIMLMQHHSSSGSTNCEVISQNTVNVKGRSNYRWTGCDFACFK
ncbi:MAG: hypothetical protein AABW58_03960 [Nanoarchaeota archaeon]